MVMIDSGKPNCPTAFRTPLEEELEGLIPYSMDEINEILSAYRFAKAVTQTHKEVAELAGHYIKASEFLKAKGEVTSEQIHVLITQGDELYDRVARALQGSGLEESMKNFYQDQRNRLQNLLDV